MGDADDDDEISRMARDNFRNMYNNGYVPGGLRQPAEDNRSAGLEPMDNRTLGGDDGGDMFDARPGPVRRGRSRRSRYRSSSPFMPDEAMLERQLRARDRKADEVTWKYVHPDNFSTAADEMYESSCDELEYEIDEDIPDLDLPLGSPSRSSKPSSPRNDEGQSPRRANAIKEEPDQPRGVSPDREERDASPPPRDPEDPEDSDRDSMHEADEGLLGMPDSESLVLETQPTRRKRFNGCFGCDWIGTDRNGAKLDLHLMNRCLNIIDQHYGKRSIASIARMVHIFFKKEIYLPCEGKIPIWRTKMIEEHIRTHVLEPRIFIGENIIKLNRLSDALYPMSFKEEVNAAGESHIIMNERGVRAFLSVQKRLIEFYRLPPRQMNFYNDDCQISFETAGKLIDVNKNWIIKRGS